MHDLPKNDAVTYEAPRLQTYGKLQMLTKGTGGSLLDGATFTKGAD